MKALLAEFRWFLACTALCGLAMIPPNEASRSVAACAYLFLGPALFVVAAVDGVRKANARRPAGAPSSGLESALVLSLRGLVGLFGLTSLLIGAAVCAWLLFLSHAGGLPLLLSLFVGSIALSRFTWARQSLSFGAGLVRSALGRGPSDLAAVPHDAAQIYLEPHGEVPVVVFGSLAEPDEAAQVLARDLPGLYPALRPAIERELLEDLEGLRDVAEGRDRESDLPRIGTAAQVWSHVEVVHVRLESFDGRTVASLVVEPDWSSQAWVGFLLIDRHLEPARSA